MAENSVPGLDSTGGNAQPAERPIRRLAILGATGSIGTATLDVVSHLNQVDPEYQWAVDAVSGHRNLAELERIAGDRALAPRQIIFSDPDAISPAQAASRFGKRAFAFGPEQLVRAASDPQVDTVVAAIVGRAGLESTVAAVRQGKRVALANKETLVVAGDLVRSEMARCEAELLPVDSEHSAIWQCIADSDEQVEKIILTASGGPFRTATAEMLKNATPESALDHPTWQMGKKITIDSATMMNKALEVIEARWLFDIPSERIEVVVHPQSIIHSLVEFVDGSVIAQLSPPDMRLPIQYALTHPRRLPCPAPRLDRGAHWNLTLEPVDIERFPAVELGFQVAKVGGTAGAVVNAANEVAVGLFLDGQIRFTDIVKVCANTLQSHTFEEHPSLERLLELDRWARQEATRCAGKLSGSANF